MKSSNYMPSLPFTGWLSSPNCPVLNNSYDLIRLLYSQFHILAGWSLELDWIKRPSMCFITTRHRPQQKHSLGVDPQETPACITSILAWRWRASVSTAYSIATVHARATENTVTVLLAACLLRMLPSSGSTCHNIFIPAVSLIWNINISMFGFIKYINYSPWTIDSRVLIVLILLQKKECYKIKRISKSPVRYVYKVFNVCQVYSRRRILIYIYLVSRKIIHQLKAVNYTGIPFHRKIRLCTSGKKYGMGWCPLKVE
jgi:hypothetical protein